MPDNRAPSLPRLDPSAAGRLLRALVADDPTDSHVATLTAGPGRGHNNDAAGAPGPGLGLAPLSAAAEPGASESDDRPDLRIPGYIVTRRVADGGGGTVYRAVRDGGSDLPLAIKLLRVRLGQTGSAAAQRAMRELQLLESLRLPATPRLHDYGQAGGHLYLVTEFIEGTPPDRYANDRSLSRRDRVALLASVADAVHSLHEHAVIHRDLKPSNILITAGGQPVILDLGLAVLKQASPADTLWAEGQPIGTPAFMAPEQARGERSVISTRTDVYGLGALGYVLVAGKTPHDTDTPSVHEAIRRVSHDPPRTVKELDATVPEHLAAVLEKACGRDPIRRYPSAAEFAADLRRWLANEPVIAAPPGRWERVLKRVARHPVLATAAACAVLVATAIGATTGTVWWINSRPCELRFDHENHAWVRLSSLNGRVVRTWLADQPGGLSSAEIVDRPSELGGGRVILISGTLRELRPLDELSPPRLAVYDMQHPARPALWFTGAGPPDLDMPALEKFTAPQRYSLHSAAVYDVFPDSPGQEVVAVLGHQPWSPVCIRIYDLAGNVLFEVWHNGYVGRAVWLDGPGLLVFAGNNSEVLWRGRDSLEAEQADEAFPVVLFAIRPVLGEKHGWLTTPSAPGDFAPAWYRCVLPARAQELFGPGAGFHLGAGLDADPSSHATLVFESMHITVNQRGEEASRLIYSKLMQRSARMPEDVPIPDEVKLGDLPPIRPGAGDDCRPPNN